MSDLSESTNKFQLFRNCNRCGTTNREVAKYCKNCGQAQEMSEFSQDKLSEILSGFYSERDLSPEEIQQVRQRINSWVNKVPHFVQNFGDIIEIKSAREIPDYRVAVAFLSESREIRMREEPYRGKEYPITSLDEDNIWNNEVIQTEKEFLARTEEYPLSRTQKVLNCEICRTSGYVRCRICDGKGVVTCDSCFGRGVLTCFLCDGRGRLECSECRGKGRIECRSCGGRGRIERSSYQNGRSVTFYEPCSNCGGTGYKTCTNCGGAGTVTCSRCYGRGVVTCSKCDGRGLLTCKTCDGSGRVTCSNCSGAGRLLNYSLVRQEYLLEEKEIRLENAYPQLMLAGKDEYTVGKKFNQVFDECAELFLEVSTDVSDPENLFSGENPVVKTILTLLGQTPLLQQNSKPVAVRVQVRKLPVFKINYEYSGTSYELWIFGKTVADSSIYSEKDPIKELEQLIAKEFNENFKNRNIEKMWQLYYQLEDIIFSQPEAESRKKLLEELLMKLADTEINLNLRSNAETLAEFCSELNKLIRGIHSKAKREFTLKKMLAYVFSKVYYPALTSAVKSGSIRRSVFLYTNFFDNKKILKNEIFNQILEETKFFSMFDSQVKNEMAEKNFSLAFKLTEVVKENTGRLPSEETVKEMKDAVHSRWDNWGGYWIGHIICCILLMAGFSANIFSNFWLIEPAVLGLLYNYFWKYFNYLVLLSFILVLIGSGIIPPLFDAAGSIIVSLILFIFMGVATSQYKKKLLNLLEKE